MSSHDPNVIMGLRLRLRRQMMGLTQQEVADAAGLDHRQIQKYETALNRMSAVRAAQVARALGMPVEQLLEGIG